MVVDNGTTKPAFERWISPSMTEQWNFRGKKFAVRVLERDAIQIKKNGKLSMSPATTTSPWNSNDSEQWRWYGES